MLGVSISFCSNTDSCEKSRIIPDQFEFARFAQPSAVLIQDENSINLSDIQSFVDDNRDLYIAGFCSYKVGEKIMGIQPVKNNPVPQIPAVAFWAFDKMEFGHTQPTNSLSGGPGGNSKIKLKSLTNKGQYLKDVARLKEHIQLGDIYEINYCIGFEAENVELDIDSLWCTLNRVSPMPFSALLDSEDFAIISASPERFMARRMNTLFIQPMKGTLAKTNKSKIESVQQLMNDPKERAENVMIVDLTRNDLSKICTRNSVQVNELFGVYEFQTIYQMISTVSGNLNEITKFEEILKATYPMGSMTGAPKKKSMELINEYESFGRGPFSGMLGYIDAKGNFDFNVLIRTIFYDKKSKKIFIGVGSAITAGSDAEKEYDECLIKLQPLLKTLNAVM